MSWTDTDVHPGWVQRDEIAYRIRRESVDLRYEWLSPIARFSPGQRRKMHLATPGFGNGTLTLELSDAVGPEVAITVYDLAGRIVEQRRVQSGAGETQPMKLQLGANGWRPGVYFVQARDQSGEVSEAAKFVYLR